MSAFIPALFARGAIVLLISSLTVCGCIRPAEASENTAAILASVKPASFDHRMTEDLTAYIGGLMRRDQVPGASVAVVQDGRVVYQQGFGLLDLSKPDPVTPSSLMMIGSTGKSMTTMMMATVVDDRKMRWDTPAVSVLPTFALSEARLTPKVTMRHLVCNCIGIERHDIGFFFATSPRTAEGVIRSLAKFPLVGTFGSTFQYSNQLVATGGYLAARVATGGIGDLYADYVTQMQRRVFDPIGMPHTTFSFDQIRSDPNHATPYGRTADYGLTPLPLELEQEVLPIAPAGGEWSSVVDLARYLITQLDRGVAPNGKRVVSSENLQYTWEPQVQATPTASYALGWGVGAYKGVRLLTHNGGTNGFTSNLSMLPDAALGIAVLTNSQNNNAFVTAIPFRVFELVYGQPEEADGKFSRRSAQSRQEALDGIRGIRPHPDWTVITPYLGVYTNPELGEVGLTRQGERLVLRAGDVRSELRSIADSTYLLWDPPLAGHQVRLRQDTAGRPEWNLVSADPDEPVTYTFTLAQVSPTAGRVGAAPKRNGNQRLGQPIR